MISRIWQYGAALWTSHTSQKYKQYKTGQSEWPLMLRGMLKIRTCHNKFLKKITKNKKKIKNSHNSVYTTQIWVKQHNKIRKNK
jgi:hypothetical protein